MQQRIGEGSTEKFPWTMNRHLTNQRLMDHCRVTETNMIDTDKLLISLHICATHRFFYRYISRYSPIRLGER